MILIIFSNNYYKFIIIPSHLTSTAEPYPPSNLKLDVDGSTLVATWTEPFSLEGVEISYVLSVTNTVTGANQTIVVNITNYTFTNSFSGGVSDCTEYSFKVYSRNDYSDSESGIREKKAIPTGNNVTNLPY